MDEPQTRRLGESIRATCKKAREDAGLSYGRVATLHVPEIKQAQTIQQWEEGDIGDWPRDPEARVDAYADATGVPPAELWQRAIDRWKSSQHSAPEVEDRPATSSGRRMPPGNPDKLLDSAGRRSQKRVQKK